MSCSVSYNLDQCSSKEYGLTCETCYHTNTIEQKHYDTVLAALTLACRIIEKSGMPITTDNEELLHHIVHGSLRGYFLMKAKDWLAESVR